MIGPWKRWRPLRRALEVGGYIGCTIALIGSGLTVWRAHIDGLAPAVIWTLGIVVTTVLLAGAAVIRRQVVQPGPAVNQAGSLGAGAITAQALVKWQEESQAQIKRMQAELLATERSKADWQTKAQRHEEGLQKAITLLMETSAIRDRASALALRYGNAVRDAHNALLQTFIGGLLGEERSCEDRIAAAQDILGAAMREELFVALGKALSKLPKSGPGNFGFRTPGSDLGDASNSELRPLPRVSDDHSQKPE